MQTIAYGNVYVAQVAMGANTQQTLQAFREAEAYPGASLILAYSHCIAHGIDMRKGMQQQDLAVATGYWPLFRYNPSLREVGRNPFVLDSPRPTLQFRDFAYNEARYRALAQNRPVEAAALMQAAQTALEEKYRSYEEMAGWSPSRFHPAGLRDSSGVPVPVREARRRGLTAPPHGGGYAAGHPPTQERECDGPLGRPHARAAQLLNSLSPRRPADDPHQRSACGRRLQTSAPRAARGAPWRPSGDTAPDSLRPCARR